MVSVPPVTLTVPLLLKARLLVVAVPLPAATVRVPLLVKLSGDAQQVPAPTLAPVFMVSVPVLLRVVVPCRSTSPDPSSVVAPWKASTTGAVVGEVRFLVAVPLIVVSIVLATSRLPSMVPPLQAKLPAPVKLPGPRNVPRPSCTVVPDWICTLLARVIEAFCSKSRVPPPVRMTPGLNSPGPTVSISVLPAPTSTVPWSLKFIHSRLALPEVEPGTVSVPVLRNSSTGGTQHALASTVAPVLIVKAPEELMSAAKASTGPAPSTVVGPWKASSAWVLPGDISIFLVVPLTVVWIAFATSRLPSMVPPVQENLPPPTNVPGPKNSAFPVSVMVLPAATDTPVARVWCAPRSNWSVPPPPMPAPG